MATMVTVSIILNPDHASDLTFAYTFDYTSDHALQSGPYRTDYGVTPHFPEPPNDDTCLLRSRRRNFRQIYHQSDIG